MATKRMQASLFYARERRRSFINVPRLSRTDVLPAGNTLPGGFPLSALGWPITFKTKIDLAGATGNIFNVGTNVTADRTSATKIDFTWKTVNIGSITTPTTGLWTIILSLIPVVGESNGWNQYERIQDDILSTPPALFAEDADDIVAGSLLIEPLSMYALQRPRRWWGTDDQFVGATPSVDNLLLNSTAWNYMQGFPQPYFEG